MKKFVILLSCFLLIPNAANAIGTKSTMNKIMDSWQNYHVNDVIDIWGYPTSEKIIAGRKLYYWTESNFSVSGNQYGVYGGENYCTRILEVDKNDKIIKWEWKGNDCPAAYFTSKKWVNPNNNPWKKK